jgi:prepilin-type processing-associated H-X9-DG protein
MRTKVHREAAFNRIELLGCIVGLTLLALVSLPLFANTTARSQRIACFNNLRRIGVGWRLWATDNGRFPWQVNIANGGSRGFVNTWQHFLIASNELQTARILACPSDTRKPATDFAQRPGGLAWSFSGEDNAVSYFAGLDAQFDNPTHHLSGDRNIAGGAPRAGCVNLPAGFAVAYNCSRNDASLRRLFWANAVHGENAGNLLFADGSVKQTTTRSFQDSVIENTGDGNFSNHLLLP